MPVGMSAEMAEGKGRISLSINARVFGIPEVKQLDFAILRLMKTQQRKAVLKEKILQRDKEHLEVLRMEVQQRRLQAHGATAYNARITKEQVRLEALDKTQERVNEKRRQETLLLLSQGNLRATNAEKAGALAILKEHELAQLDRSNHLLRINRREILASTMSIFGMTMSIWQITNAFSALAGENKELKKDMQTLQAVMMGATGPIMLAMGMTQLSMAWTRLNMVIRMSMPLFFTMAAIYMTMVTHSRELKIVFGALTGAMAGLTAIIWMHNIAQAHKNTLTLASIKLKLIDIGVWSLGSLLPIAFAAAGAAIAYGATIPEAQTELGQYRRMARDAPIYAHEDEVVSRPMEDWGSGTRGGDTIVVIDGEVIDRVEARKTQRNLFVGIS